MTNGIQIDLPIKQCFLHASNDCLSSQGSSILEHERGEEQRSPLLGSSFHLPQESEDLIMKFWRLIGFITTGGPAVRGQAWNFLSVSSHHPLFDIVLVVVPE